MKLNGLRKTVAIVATLNLLYFFVEFTFAQIFGSLSLLSDSLDFLEDASINILIFIAFAFLFLYLLLLNLTETEKEQNTRRDRERLRNRK